MIFSKSHWRTYEQGIQKEWLLTNGIGGFASSTIIGANARRYHGLLIASLNPPTARHLVLSMLAESVKLKDMNVNLYSFSTNNFKLNGQNYLQKMEQNPLPTFYYNVSDLYIEKTISMEYGKNIVAITYKVKTGKNDISFKIAPLINYRDYHFNSHVDHLKFEFKSENKSIFLKSQYSDKFLEIYSSEGVFYRQEDNYFIGMHYAYEQERGLDAYEDHYVPGFFQIDQKAGEEKIYTVIAAFDETIKEYNGEKIISNEKNRLSSLIKKSGLKNELAKRLVIAADAFIVDRKSTNAKTIIAGYPWFTDWGRDTMIALPGLTLSTKRFEDAKNILYTFSKYVKDGLIPNMFPDNGEEPCYNSVDGALWYFEACYKYVKHTNDFEFIKTNILDSLISIVEHFMVGTSFNIFMDKDYLLSAGDEHTQLTWMDAKIGNWVVTPRNGKTVEINALWYNALMILSEFMTKMGGEDRKFSELAEKCKKSFVDVFWNQNRKCLYDVINGNLKDESIRPNQIFALSLTHPVISGETAKSVLDVVWNDLYTSHGLRSLSPRFGAYVGLYYGDQYRRDGAYHQGTVWAWLIGHFIIAYASVYRDNKDKDYYIKKFVEPFKYQLDDGCIGSISEIFDGDEPLIPRGCFAQAWSVAEVLRTITELEIDDI